jgi:hypothetical protein
MHKVVITDAEVRQALRAQGRRRATGHRFRKVAAQLKAQKMASQTQV